MGRLAAGAALGVAGTALTLAAAWLGVVYAGAYNVAASDGHADVVRWSLDTTMRRSVERRAGEGRLAEEVSLDMLAQGAARYAESCEHCHGGPGVAPAAWSRGMRPEPPLLVEAAAEWSAREIYWLIENGVKMSGMPAFGRRLGAPEIAAIAAFATRLPALAPDDYAALSRTGAADGG